MQKKGLALALILIIVIVPLTTQQKTVLSEMGTIIYDFFVNDQGDAQIKIEIDIPLQSGATWLYLPNNITWKMSIKQGIITDS